jgi:ferredoxin
MEKKNIAISIKPGCVSCGCCAAIAPDIFAIKGIAHVIKSGDLTPYASAIEKAESMCPVKAIHIEKATYDENK